RGTSDTPTGAPVSTGITHPPAIPHRHTTTGREVPARGGPARSPPGRARLMLRLARAARWRLRQRDLGPAPVFQPDRWRASWSLWWVLSSGDVDGLRECGLGDRGGDAVAHDGNDGGAAGEVAGQRGAFDGVCP